MSVRPYISPYVVTLSKGCTQLTQMFPIKLEFLDFLYSLVTLSFFKVCEQLTRIVTSKISIDEVTKYCELVNGSLDQLNIHHLFICQSRNHIKFLIS